MQNRLILCCGFRGSGKSTVASNILRANNPSFLFDPHGPETDDPFRWMRNVARGEKQLVDYFRWLSESLRVDKAPKRVALRYVPDGTDDPYDALNWFCGEMWDRICDAWVCIDEVSDACRGVSAQGMPPELRRVVNQGRHRRLNAVFCGLRYAEIPRPLSAGANVQVIFATREPGDLDEMRKRIGGEATEKVHSLAKYEAVICFPDRSYQVIGSREAGIAELVLRDSAEVPAEDEAAVAEAESD